MRLTEDMIRITTHTLGTRGAVRDRPLVVYVGRHVLKDARGRQRRFTRRSTAFAAARAFIAEHNQVDMQTMLRGGTLAAERGCGVVKYNQLPITIPWDDCKVAFGIDDADPFDTERSEPLPHGWELNEVDGTGARWVAVFRVKQVPTPEDGRAVRRWLQDIGAVIPPCVTSMGCLCVCHAAGMDAGDPCDTSEERARRIAAGTDLKP